MMFLLRVDRYGGLKYRMMFLQEDKNDGIKGEIVKKNKLAMMLRDSKSLHVGLGWITEPYHVSKLSTRGRVGAVP